MFEFAKKIFLKRIKVFWLTGGIGNQLFILAASKNIENKSSVYFDLQNFNFDFREFKLDKFTFKIKKANWYQLLFFRPKIKKISSFFLKNTKYYPIEILEKNTDNGIISFNQDRFIYIQGYWQSYVCYKDTLIQVRQDYQLNNKLKTEKYFTFQHLINDNNSVAVHIRRTDYLTNENIKVFNVLDENYYNNCILELSNRINRPLFFVFSEDIEWAKNNLNYNGHDVVYVSDILNIDYLEFDLMRQCKHIITANSTYSWWAAELNDNKDKIIFAPLKYFNDNHLQEKYANKELLFNSSFIYR